MPERAVTSSNVPLPRLRYSRCRARAATAGIGERSAVDEEDVDPAVVVEVEEQAAPAHGLDADAVGARAVDVVEVQTPGARYVREYRRLDTGGAGAASRR